MCGPQLSRKRPLIFMPRAGVTTRKHPPTQTCGPGMPGPYGGSVSVEANMVRPPVHHFPF